MAIMSFDADEVVDYIPESERNCDDPCIISMKFVGFGKVKKYSELIAQKVRGFRPNDERHSAAQAEVQKKQFCENIVGVKNYFVNGREITTAEELYSNAATKLIYELIAAMEDNAKLTEGQAKNSKGGSSGVSLPEASTESPSTVIPAENQTKTPETATTGSDLTNEHVQ